MSVEYYFCCHSCRKKVHVGCEGFSGLQFWSGEKSAMDALQKLLNTCLLHHKNIGVIKEQSVEDEEYEEIE